MALNRGYIPGILFIISAVTFLLLGMLNNGSRAAYIAIGVVFLVIGIAHYRREHRKG